jgi:histidyl-tRNA synthetase
MEDSFISYGLKAASELRHLSVQADLLTSGKLAKRIQKAEKRGYSYIGIVGSTEFEASCISIKNLKTGEQSLVALNKLTDYFKS